MSRKVVAAVLGVCAGAALPLAYSVFGFSGLSFEAVCALGILLGSIIWWVAGVLPEYVTALVMVILFMVVAGVPTGTVFSTFSSSTWWLLLGAYGLGLGVQKSGLLRRMALAIMRVFPRTFKSQAAGLIAAGTLIGPFIPSLSAKAVMLAPLSMEISDSMGYVRKGREANGLFLAMFTGIRTVGPAVISASIIGYGIVALLPEDVQQQFTMLHWFAAMIPWFVVVMVLNYVAIVALYAPRGEKARRSGGRAAKNAGVGVDAEAGVDSDSADGGETQVRAVDVGGEAQTGASAPANGEARMRAASAEKTPMSRHEKQMAVIMVACIVLWITEPIHGIGSHVVAVGALVASLACGVFGKADFRSGIAWDSLIFIGCVLGLAEVFAYLGIDTWIVSMFQPMFGTLASNPYLFVAGIGVITVILRFVIVSEMACINIFMAFMVPLALSFGINPWVVGVTIYAMVNPWFVLYQNPIYMSAFYATDGQMVNHSAMARYCAVYLGICLVGLLASVPLWQSMGLL